MIKVQFNGATTTSAGITREFQQFLKRLAADVEREVKKNTPVRTGRARAGWDTQMKETGFVTENKVPYVGYLDKPYYKSKQAPQGIVGPSLNTIKGKYK